MARKQYPYYVETSRPDAPIQGAYVRAHQIPNTGFDFKKLSPNITTLFHVYQALNTQHAIALVCEYAAGMNETIVTLIGLEALAGYLAGRDAPPAGNQTGNQNNSNTLSNDGSE